MKKYRMYCDHTEVIRLTHWVKHTKIDFLNDYHYIVIQMSLNSVPWLPFVNLVRIGLGNDLRWSGDKPITESMLAITWRHMAYPNHNELK